MLFHLVMLILFVYSYNLESLKLNTLFSAKDNFVLSLNYLFNSLSLNLIKKINKQETVLSSSNDHGFDLNNYFNFIYQKYQKSQIH